LKIRPGGASASPSTRAHTSSGRGTTGKWFPVPFSPSPRPFGRRRIVANGRQPCLIDAGEPGAATSAIFDTRCRRPTLRANGRIWGHNCGRPPLGLPGSQGGSRESAAYQPEQIGQAGKREAHGSDWRMRTRWRESGAWRAGGRLTRLSARQARLSAMNRHSSPPIHNQNTFSNLFSKPTQRPLTTSPSFKIFFSQHFPQREPWENVRCPSQRLRFVSGRLGPWASRVPRDGGTVRGRDVRDSGR